MECEATPHKLLHKVTITLWHPLLYTPSDYFYRKALRCSLLLYSSKKWTEESERKGVPLRIPSRFFRPGISPGSEKGMICVKFAKSAARSWFAKFLLTDKHYKFYSAVLLFYYDRFDFIWQTGDHRFLAIQTHCIFAVPRPVAEER